MTSIPVYCLCQSPYDANHFMIECDLCQQWFHGSCVGVEEEKAIDIDVYHCPKCEILHGPSIMKKCRRTQAQKLIGKKAAGKTGQTGSPEFTQERRQRRVNSTKKVSDLPRPRNSKAKKRVQTKTKKAPNPQPKQKINKELDAGSKEELKVEETLQKKTRRSKKMLPQFHQKLLPASPCSDPNRIQEPGEVEFETEENYTAEKKVEERVEGEAESPVGARGIFYLLKASKLLEEPDCVGHNKTPVSPNTMEAVQGLLLLANPQPVSSSSPASSVQAWWASGDSSGSSAPPKKKGSDPQARQGTRKRKAVKQLANDSTESQGGEVKTHKVENVRNHFKETLENSFKENVENSVKDKEYTNFLESNEDHFASKVKPKKKKRSADDAPWIPKVSLEEPQVKEVLSKKQETLRTLSLHCQEKDTEAVRQLAVTGEHKKRITKLSSNIQEERPKKRKQRTESGRQLEGMMEKHKRADTRSQQMSSSSSSSHKDQLMMEERQSQEKPGSLQAQVGALIGPEGMAEATGASGEDAFLGTVDAAAAVQLLEEENKKATEVLEAAILHYHQLQQKYQRMKRQLEALSGKQGSQERSPEGAAGGKSSVVTKAVMEIPKKD